MANTKSLQFAQLLAAIAQAIGDKNPGTEAVMQMNSAALEAEALKKAKKEQEKEKKSGMFGSIGSTLGTIGGVALAPFTGGTSIAATAALGAAGSTVGGSLGRLAGGGDATPQIMDAVSGAMAGGMSGMQSARAANAAKGGAVSPGVDMSQAAAHSGRFSNQMHMVPKKGYENFMGPLTPSQIEPARTLGNYGKSVMQVLGSANPFSSFRIETDPDNPLVRTVYMGL